MKTYDLLANSYYNAFYKDILHDSMNELVKHTTSKNLDLFDLEVIEKVAANQHFFYNILLDEIINLLKNEHILSSELEIEILVRDRDDYNANIDKDTENDNRYLLFIDNLMLTAIRSLVEVMLYWDINYENSNKWAKCFKYTVFILTEYGKIRTRPKTPIWVHKFETEMITYSANTTHLFVNVYIAIITFIMLHEIGHLVLGHLNPIKKGIEYELDADDFAYKAFLKIIQKQVEYIASNKKRPHVDVYNEYTYLAPLMFFDIMDLMKYFRNKAYNDATFHTASQKLTKRKKHLEDWVFYITKHYDFDSDEGNDVYNAFLNSKDRFISEVELKMQRGKKIIPENMVEPNIII